MFGEIGNGMKRGAVDVNVAETEENCEESVRTVVRMHA
jgi:hypothetical protein